MSKSSLKFVISFFIATASSAASETAPAPQHYEQSSIAVEFSVGKIGAKSELHSPLSAGDNALVTFRLTDVESGQPITGLHPKAWMSARLSEQLADETTCKDKVRGFMAGLLATRPDYDLNSYLVLTLNHDKTITLINPQVSFNSTKLENIIPLPGNGIDWVLSSNRDFLYVTMPDVSSVAVIDTATSKLLRTLSTGSNSSPGRIVLQPDGQQVLVGLDGSSGIAAIDTQTNQIVRTIPVGQGLHNIEFTADSHFAYVTNSADNTVTAIDVKRREKIADIPVEGTPTALTYGSASGLVYVSAINGVAVSAIDPEKQAIVAIIPVKHGVTALRFEPDGRFALAVNQIDSTLTVIDSATNAIIGETKVVQEPDQVAFTERYAYIRGLGSEKFSLIDLSELRAGRFAPIEIQAGRLIPSAEPQDIGIASMIVPTPEGNSVIIANAPDRMLYFYQEGMMAPMGTFSNYDRKPHALMILDRSTHETAPGIYTAQVKLTKGGSFDVPLLIDQPRLLNCFRTTVADSADAPKAVRGKKLIVELLSEFTPPQAQEPTRIKFKIVDTTTNLPVVGLKDGRALIFEPPGIWQQRRPAAEIGQGVYVVEQTFPRAGLYNLMFSAASRGIRFADLPLIVIKVESDTRKTEPSQ